MIPRSSLCSWWLPTRKVFGGVSLGGESLEVYYYYDRNTIHVNENPFSLDSTKQPFRGITPKL
jgi:hypothetical protein